MEVTPVQMHLKTLGVDNVLLSDADHPWPTACLWQGESFLQTVGKKFGELCANAVFAL